jgi:hypothetical protein
MRAESSVQQTMPTVCLRQDLTTPVDTDDRCKIETRMEKVCRIGRAVISPDAGISGCCAAESDAGCDPE